MAARIGGDEFVVLLSNIHSVDDTKRSTHEIQQAIAKSFYYEGRELSITASVGVAVYPDDGEEVDILMSRADAAMYKDKSASRKPSGSTQSERVT